MILNKRKNSVIAIGNFDGVHLGHKKVLKEAKKKAKEKKLKAGVLTFEPVPVMFFNKNITNHRINNFNQKIKYLKMTNIDFLKVIKFNENFSNLSPANFIKKIIFKKLKAKYIFVSKNFRFGKNREGNTFTLKKYEKNFSYKTIVSNPLRKKGKVLSSTIIRSKIKSGKIKEVKNFLGRSWSIEGKVVKGNMRGRKIGFPTCNIMLKDYIMPKLGVYSVLVKFGKFKKKGIANIGYRPTFGGKTLLLEVNIFGLKKNLYKKNLTVEFVNFIRNERKFKNINELKKQIKKDVVKAKS